MGGLSVCGCFCFLFLVCAYEVRRHEQSKLLTVGRASRLEVLRRYLVRFHAGEATEKKTKVVQRKRRHANVVSEALHEEPALCQHVAQEGGGPGKVKIRHTELKDFVAQNREQLQANARRKRDSAPAVGDHAILPLTNQAWLAWLDQNFQHFHDNILPQATEERRALNHRLIPSAEFVNVAPDDSADFAQLPGWARVLEGRCPTVPTRGPISSCKNHHCVVNFVVRGKHPRYVGPLRKIPGMKAIVLESHLPCLVVMWCY